MVKFRCQECSWCGWESQLLRAPNPFADDDTEEMFGCPNCHQPNTMARACDESGCDREASNGTNTPQGYRWSCYEHRPQPAAST